MNPVAFAGQIGALVVFEILLWLSILALAFLLSRLALKQAFFPATAGGLIAAHAATAAVIIAVDVLLKYPFRGFNPMSVFTVVICQAIWYFYDWRSGRVPAARQ